MRKLVLSYGGRIEVTDNEPRGALFTIYWPKSPQAARFEAGADGRRTPRGVTSGTCPPFAFPPFVRQ